MIECTICNPSNKLIHPHGQVHKYLTDTAQTINRYLNREDHFHEELASSHTTFKEIYNSQINTENHFTKDNSFSNGSSTALCVRRRVCSSLNN